MYKYLSIILMAVWMTGCSVIPDKIQLPEGSQLTRYEDAAAKSDQVKGQWARWGGVIAKVDNKADNTVFEVVYYPLKSYGRPVISDESMGRFRVYVKGFMDPMVYKVGRAMTFTGQLSELEEGLVGEHKYVFPTIQSNGYYLWQEIQQVDVTSINVWPYDYWGGWYPRPYHRGIIIRSGGRSSAPSGAATQPKPVDVKRDIK